MMQWIYTDYPPPKPPPPREPWPFLKPGHVRRSPSRPEHLTAQLVNSHQFEPPRKRSNQRPAPRGNMSPTENDRFLFLMLSVVMGVSSILMKPSV